MLLLALAPHPASAQGQAAAADDRARLAEALRELHQRSFARARQMLEGLLASPGLDPEVEELAQLQLARIRRRFTVHTQRIGLIAPLSGQYQGLGEALVRGARLALEQAGGPSIIVEDSQGTPEGAAAAVDRLVHEQGVVALLGPLGDRECRAAALRATELELPIVLLGAAEDLPGLSPWVFRHRISPEDQARAIASHALLDLGMRSFAILYPDDAYGRAMMNAFWDVVERGGGEVRGAEAYPAQGAARDVDPAVRRLLGGFYAKARQEPFEIKGKKSKQLAYQPVVDFEALFLPESPRRAREILSLVSYYDVSFRHDDGKMLVAGSRAAHTPVQVLGPGSWNSPLLARGAEPVVQGAHFPGTLVPDSPQPVVRSFVQAYHARHRRMPSELEAQAYDAAGWLFVAWQRGAGQGRPAVQAALLRVGGFVGVGGVVHVGPDGGTRTEPTILTVRGAALIPLLYPGDRARAPASRELPGQPAIRMRY